MLVTFEGTEGAGKSTLIGAVADALRARGLGVTQTREPGGSPVAESIRQVILDQEMDPWTELFLYEAARAEHLARTVRPALARGEIVLCDRFTDSSLAYQSSARGLPWARVHALNEAATRGLSPNLTVLLDIDPAVGLRRARVRTRFEAEGVEFQKKVRLGFLKSRRLEPRRWMTLQAMSGTPEQLAATVIQQMESRFRLPKGKKTARG